MAGEEQICQGYGDFIPLVSDDDDFTEEIQNPGEDPVKEDVVEEMGSGDPEDSGSDKVREEVDSSDEEDPDRVEESGSAGLDDLALYEIKRKYYHVTRTEWDVASGARKRRSVESEIDLEEEDSDLWRCCRFVAESLELEHFSKHFLPDSGLRLVKRRLAVYTNKVMDLEERCKRLHKAEVELDLMRAELIQSQTKLVLQVL